MTIIVPEKNNNKKHVSKLATVTKVQPRQKTLTLFVEFTHYVKNSIFKIPVDDIFPNFAPNLDCWCSLEPSMFLTKIRV